MGYINFLEGTYNYHKNQVNAGVSIPVPWILWARTYHGTMSISERKVFLSYVFWYFLNVLSLRIQSPSQMMIGAYNHFLRKVFRFHYHSQKVIGSLGFNRKPSTCFCFFRKRCLESEVSSVLKHFLKMSLSH